MLKTANSNRKFFDAAIFCAVFIFTVCSAQAATFTVSNLSDADPGSLRDAITQANATAGNDLIDFSTGAGTIDLLTPLPAITDAVLISGGSTPTIELNGLATQGAGSASIGLYLRTGNSFIQGFIINRFGEAGIRMDTDAVGIDNGNVIWNNYIGTNAAGTSSSCGVALCGNINRGILIVGTTGHFIGDSFPAFYNVISGNQGNGIEITAGGSATIRGNYIGTNAAGTGDLGNSLNGILIANSSDSLIGGTTSDFRNVISGNNGSGISILTDFGFTASNNAVEGNFIGVDVTGNTALRNDGSGVSIQASGNTIGGGTVAGRRNVISGNGASGVSLATTLASGNLVRGNYIGVGADGTTAIGNRSNGVQISGTAANNTIGNTGVTSGACDNGCNVIANNGDVNSFSARAGIDIDPTAGAGNAIRGNSIFSNGVPANGSPVNGLGMDLGGVGVTANDACDADAGPNNLQNSPVISTASSRPYTGGGFINSVSGSLDSTLSTTFTIEFFTNTALDPTTSGEGETFLGSTTVTTDANCIANFTFVLLTPIDYAGKFVTATATNPANSTSEFSPGSPIAPGPSAAPANISGRITNANGVPVGGATIGLSGGANHTTITDAAGNYQFNNLETGQFYTVTPSLANYHFSPSNRSFSLVANQTDAGFTATADASQSANAIDSVEYFVRQQYLDFLGREPDQGGFDYWTSQFTQCSDNAACILQKRIDVSAAFFMSGEFQETGSYVYDMYAGLLGRTPGYNEFTPDRAQVVGGSGLDAAKTAFAQNFVQRSEFTSRYPAGLTRDQFVDAVLQTMQQRSGVDLSSQRAGLLADYDNGGRPLVARHAAELALFVSAEYNRAFVLMEYFGYLRRGEDTNGYAFWLNVLNQGSGNNYRRMVCSFLTSTEYQHRFSSVVTHNNGECGQ